MLGHHLLIAAVNGFTLDETGAWPDAPSEDRPLEQGAVMARDYLASLPPDRFPNLVALAGEFSG